MQPRSQEEIEADIRHNEAARREMMRQDGQRSLGENLEQADALIKAMNELARGLRGGAAD